MATVRLTDAIVPDIFNMYMVEDTTKHSKVFESGIVRLDSEISAKLAGGGTLFQTPVWDDLGNDFSGSNAPTVGSDDPASLLVPQKLSSYKHQCIRNNRTAGWQAADLVRELAGSDPMRRISSRVSKYWGLYYDFLTIQTLKGVFHENDTNDSDDRILDVRADTGTETVGGATVNTRQLSAKNILEAKQLLGDDAEGLEVILMHSHVFTRLQLQNLIIYIPNSRGEITIPTYLGYRVVVADQLPNGATSMPVAGATPAFIANEYVTFLCAPGIIGYGEHSVEIPVEVEREALQGDGMGVETLVTRRQFAMHPYGHTVESGGVAGTFPTDAEVANAAMWDRTYTDPQHFKAVAIYTRED